MAIPTAEKLIEELRSHHLLSPAQLAELEEMPDRPSDSKELAKEIVQRQWLTRYQINTVGELVNKSEEDLLAITEALLAKAKQGSVGAAKLLLAYGIGKPASAPDPDRLDGQELKHFKEQVEAVNEVHELAREVGRAVDRRPGPASVSDDFSALLREMVCHSEQYDNPVCLQAVANVLNESATDAGAAWVPPSTNGLFGGLPPRIRELSQALFVVNEPSANEDLPPEEETPGN